ITLGHPLIEPEVNVSLTYSLTLDEGSAGGAPTFLGGAGALGGGVNNMQFNAFPQLPLANLFNDGVTSSLRPGISYDTRDNRLFPTSGVFLSASSEWAMAALGSQNRFVRNRWTGRFYLPLYKTLVLKLNTNAGMVTSPTEEGVPIFARF